LYERLAVATAVDEKIGATRRQARHVLNTAAISESVLDDRPRIAA
jgi:hypothetical protein